MYSVYTLKKEDKKTGKITFTNEFFTKKKDAIDRKNNLNDLGKGLYEYTLVTLVEISEKSDYSKMTQVEFEKYQKEVNDMSNDICGKIIFDEYAFRFYGEERIDYDMTASALYAVGYRKVAKAVKKEGVW